MAFLQTNGNTRVVMYFANDGGIYRALDGYTGLLTGACGGSNQFDSLNADSGLDHPVHFLFAASH